MLWKQFKVGMECAQLQIGVRDCIYNYDYNKYHNLLPHSWIKSQWKFLSNMGLHLKGWNTKLEYQRRNDKSIMENFVELGIDDSTLQHLNECRLYLEVMFTSDVANGHGDCISPLSRDGIRDIGRRSIFQWPYKRRPTLYSQKNTYERHYVSRKQRIS